MYMDTTIIKINNHTEYIYDNVDQICYTYMYNNLWFTLNPISCELNLFLSNTYMAFTQYALYYTLTVQ